MSGEHVSHSFTRAIVRPPPATLGRGLTNSAHLGAPDTARALAQHAAYCDALRRCGLAVTVLDADPAFPDSTFVEDTAVLVGGATVVTRPGAPTRRDEVAIIRAALDASFPSVRSITEPGTLDGGDVCATGREVFIGISARTNEAGASQLAAFLREVGVSARTIDIRGIPEALHLKSGLSALGDDTLVAIPELAEHEAFAGYRMVPIIPGEEYAANCVRVNGQVLIASGYPYLLANLTWMGFETVELDMSEFQKMDGGLSCLSLRF